MDILERVASSVEKQEMVEYDNEPLLDVLNSYKKLDRDRGLIDFRKVEELYFRLKEKVKNPQRIRVFDDGTTIFCDGKRIDGLTPTPKRLIVAMVRKGYMDLYEMAQAIWNDSDTSRKTIQATICQLNRILLKQNIPFLIERRSYDGVYELVFLENPKN